jgi:hypothetical protein
VAALAAAAMADDMAYSLLGRRGLAPA